MTNTSCLLTTYEQYKDFLSEIVTEKLINSGLQYSKTDTENITHDIWQNNHHEIEIIYAAMALLDITSPKYDSQEYKDIESIVTIYTGMHILKQQKLRTEQEEQSRRLAEYHLQARQYLESEYLTAKSQILTDTKTQVEQDLIQFKHQQNLSKKAAELEEVLRINFGKTFANLVAANNERFVALNHPQYIKTPDQYSNNAKIARLLFDINKLQQEQFNKLCLDLIHNHKTSNRDKKLITELQSMVSPVFNITALDNNFARGYTNQWQKFAEFSRSKDFQNKFQECNPSVRQRFLDICIFVLTCGFVNPQNSAQKFASSTKQILSVSLQVNKILHGDQKEIGCQSHTQTNYRFTS